MKKYIKYILLLGILGFGLGFYLYNKPHKNIKQTRTDFKIEAVELFNEFEQNESAANKKYLDKIIEVSGKVSELLSGEEGMSITLESEDLMFGIICEMDPYSDAAKTEIKIGERITLKGICSGMLSDVVLVRCVVP